jgi:MGT family glycosyltransferase
MANVLFLGMPSHGHIHPTLGLVSELTRRGEKVTYFASEEFKDKLEAAGAIVKYYQYDLNIFKAKRGGFLDIAAKAPEIITDILSQIADTDFDYIIHSAAFLFAKPITQILRIPAICSLAVFAGLREFTGFRLAGQPGMETALANYQAAAKRVEDAYGITMPDDIMQLILNKSGLNLVYTSRYFVPDPNFFDDSYAFVGPPIYERQEDMNFPFEQLAGKQVLYISLGTVFGNFDLSLYQQFFDAFADWNGVVVLSAHQAGLSSSQIPANFILRDYVPQNALLKHTDVAITHGGMNSMSDLISNHVPFVCIPLGADQPLLAARAAELGAAISLDAKTLTPSQLRESVNEVLTNPSYLSNIKKIDDSFRTAGGYEEAMNRIFMYVGKR